MTLTDTLAYLHERITRRPRIQLVLGSGLGTLADELEDAVRIPFTEIPGFSPATVEGHRGALVAGRLEGTECIALQGRYHLYEGYSPEAVTLPVRAATALGARTLIVTNAAGGINRAFRPGDLMIIDDHINLMGGLSWARPKTPEPGPQTALNAPGEGRRDEPQDDEPNTTKIEAPYDRGLNALIERAGLDHGVRTVRGIYAAVTGPSYETPAEIRMLERLGADAVGMSTVPEVMTARALGVRVVGVSLISNTAAGISAEPLSHEAVVAAGIEAHERFGTLIRTTVQAIGALPDIEVD